MTCGHHSPSKGKSCLLHTRTAARSLFGLEIDRGFPGGAAAPTVKPGGG
jgi:hypothetical protein